MGYAFSKFVRLYGEEFELVSDPFADADGIAIQVITRKDPRIRVLRIPETVLQSAKGWGFASHAARGKSQLDSLTGTDGFTTGSKQHGNNPVEIVLR
jgi:hypothetical protein